MLLMVGGDIVSIVITYLAMLLIASEAAALLLSKRRSNASLGQRVWLAKGLWIYEGLLWGIA